jgi:hypothetical protein
MTSEYKNKANNTLEEVVKLLDNSKLWNNHIVKISKEIENLKSSLTTEFDSIKNEKKLIEETIETLNSRIETFEEKIEEVESTFENHPDLDDELEKLDEFYNKVEDNSNKTNQILKTITSRRTEIDKLYYEIIGFEEVNDDDEKTFVPGLKDELKEAYDGLEESSNKLSKHIDEIQKTTVEKHKIFIEESNTLNNDLFKLWEKNFSEIHSKIQSLLPNALTAGLSYAFSEKKDEEVQSYEKHKTQFGYGIIGLICVSIIPFILSIFFLLNGDKWDLIIDRTPRIVLAIIPLYLPVLWLAFSSSKKINLSKRLIEEYSHKEVLSKTFEGLSSQINDLENQEISDDLRINLLQNFLQVYSENPGKLISNYETSDHPIMEVLEKSYKLEAAVEKLQKIPGMGKISKILDAKSKRLIKENEDIIKEGIEAIEENI